VNGNPDLWTPARYVHAPAKCFFCGGHIPKSAPGSRVGDRGTKAFYNSALKRFECMECRMAATDADIASQRPRAPRAETCASCGYSRLDTDSHAAAPLFALRHCCGCDLAPGHGLHRTCPRCGHLEHLVYELQPTIPETIATRSEAA